MVTCREKKELKARQAKMSMETCKQVMSDKTIKNKAERDRFVLATVNDSRRMAAVSQRLLLFGPHVEFAKVSSCLGL